MPLKTKDELKQHLKNAGFTELKDGKTTKTVVVELPKGGDRENALREIAKKLSKQGAKYNPTGGQSSVGRVEFTGGYYVECKIKGGGGSGAGADVTRLGESAQCVYNAAHFNGKNYTHKDMKEIRAKYDTDEKIDNVLNKLPDPWIYSSKVTAEILKKKFNTKARSYTHHRGSAWVNKLYAHVNQLNKEAGKPFGDANKWSPADIWMLTSRGEQVNLTKAETLVELNNMLLANYKTKDIIGVSLKKIERTPKFKELNMERTRPSWKFESTTSGIRGFFQSNDGYLYGDGFKAQFRRFGSTWQGELKGKTANMGKMSGGPIKGLIDYIDGGNFIPQRDLSERNDKTMKMFYGWYSDCPDTPPMKEQDFYVEVMKKDMNWFISKIMTAQLISRVSKMNRKNKDRFASGLANYAGSESELSGPYCKVYE